MTDNTAANAVVAYHRAADGTLTLAGTYYTHGLGGVLSGSVVDHTASEGALTYDRPAACCSRSTRAATASRSSGSPVTGSA